MVDLPCVLGNRWPTFDGWYLTALAFLVAKSATLSGVIGRRIAAAGITGNNSRCQWLLARVIWCAAGCVRL